MKWPDANIYNVITNGQNVMPGYAKSVSRDDRWAIINYIRVLQRSQNAPDSDLETTGLETTGTNEKTDSLKVKQDTVKTDANKKKQGIIFLDNFINGISKERFTR